MRVLVCQPATENMRASFARRFPEHEFIYEEHPSDAALDVVSPEPLPPEHRLWGCENAIITPHVAGKSFSPDIIESIGELFERNFAAFLAKKPLVTPVDRETGYMRSRR